jgi:large subunit ribosomal protein L4
VSSTTVDVVDASGAKTGTADLPAEIFDVTANIPLMHQVVVAQQAAARQGTHKTKTRGEVSGGGAKPYKQKGTGRARQGSTRAPQFTGGGVVHGPQPRDYSQRTPKKMKVGALRGALSDRARGGRVHVISSLVTGDTPSTKDAVKAIANISTARHVLLVLSRGDQTSWLSVRNIDHVHVISPDQLNTYDVLVSDDVVFVQSALECRRLPPLRAMAASTPRRTRSDLRPAGHPARSGRLGEELRAAGREQVHVLRAAGRQQDPDQDRGRAGVQRQGHGGQHAEPAGEAEADQVRHG